MRFANPADRYKDPFIESVRDELTKPLPVAANDNNPQGGQYIGLTRPSRPPPRVGDWMQTYTARQFWPLDPRADEVFIEDIAHSLAMQCRYAGHSLKFYSVAEHSVLLCQWVLDNGGSQDEALWGLLHDASEAYLVDVPRPLKRHLRDYKAAEDRVMASVVERFGLSAKMPDIVHEADSRIIADELCNMRRMDWHAKHDDWLGVTLKFWSPEAAEKHFMWMFGDLAEGRVRG